LFETVAAFDFSLENSFFSLLASVKINSKLKAVAIVTIRKVKRYFK